MSDSCHGNRAGGCRGHVLALVGYAGRHSRSPACRGQALQAAPRFAVCDPRHRVRLQLLPRRRHLHRRPPRQAERRLRADMAACARAYRHPLHPPRPRLRGGGSGVPPPCHPTPRRLHQAWPGQHRARRQDASGQLRQVPRPGRSPDPQRVGHRHRLGPGPCRHRREVQRNSRSPGAAGRTRPGARLHRHPGRAALPKNCSNGQPRPASP